MLYRLSLAWGVPVRVLSDELSASDIEGYLAYYQLEPWGCAPQDQRTALIAYTTHRTWGGKGDFKDFVPTWSRPEPPTYRQWADQFAAYAEGHNSRVRHN